MGVGMANGRRVDSHRQLGCDLSIFCYMLYVRVRSQWTEVWNPLHGDSNVRPALAYQQ